jgi:Icc-related predicted phosphoesterase
MRTLRRKSGSKLRLRPRKGWKDENMRLVFVSDTHLLDFMRETPLVIPDGDVLVHCGDATMRGDYQEIALFATRFAAYPHKRKIFVPGNHDWEFQRAYERYRPGDEDSFGDLSAVDWADVLIDRAVIIDGVKFYGSPWQPEFCNWAFNLPRGAALREKWDLIPDDTDVLVTHGPPMGVLDRVWTWKPGSGKMTGKPAYSRRIREHVGCADLMAAVKRVNPKVHAFGHIHSDYGTRSMTGLRTAFINCALANEKYHLTNKPVVFDL